MSATHHVGKLTVAVPREKEDEARRTLEGLGEEVRIYATVTHKAIDDSLFYLSVPAGTEDSWIAKIATLPNVRSCVREPIRGIF